MITYSTSKMNTMLKSIVTHYFTMLEGVENCYRLLQYFWSSFDYPIVIYG